MKKIFLFAFILSVSKFCNAQILSPLIDSIPMSDGRKLAADIYIPNSVTSAPVILIQTPYNRLNYRLGLPLGIAKKIDSSKYIFVIVDWRGFYGSSSAAHVGAPSLGQDGYNCVEWIAQQSWCNSKIGTWGPSALGKVQFQTAKLHPPHLTCICPLVAAPQYEYEEYFPNGVLRTEYVEQLDNLGYGMTPILMAHQTKDVAWNYSSNINNYPDSIAVPCFMIGGWYDHTIQFMLPFFTELQNQSPISFRSQHKLMMGPWVHGGHGAAQVGSSLQGQLSYPNAVDVDDSMALLFFDYYLRNQNNNWLSNPPVTYYQLGDNNWTTSNNLNFGTTPYNFYLHQNGELNTSFPNTNSDKLSYTYNPINPSPTVGGPTLRNDLNQGPYDQAPLVENRNDILKFSTPVLSQPIVLKGEVEAHFKFSSDKMDTDVDIRLCDVYPDGKSMLINHGATRLRFRNGNAASDTSHIQPNQIYDVVIKLPATCLTFLPGHQIRLDITSSNYPAFNRNMNTGKEQYPFNNSDTLINPQIASNTIYCNSIYSSYIKLPLENYIAANETIGFNDEINIYPNPSNEQINFETNQKGNVIIYSLDGKQISAFEIFNSKNISVSNWNQGIYVAEFHLGNKIISKNFTIAK